MNENEKLEIQRQRIIKKYGAWTAHNILLKNGVRTISSELTGDEFKLRRIIQNISDFTGKPFKKLRILDLACLEGLYGIECARQGARTVLVDARQANLEKVRFAKEALKLKNLDIIKDDVRNLNVKDYGKFDVILCLGIFYHLDHSDLFDFTVRMYNATKNLVIFDTHIASNGEKSFIRDGVEYFGKRYMEHRIDADENEMETDVWKSLDNRYSFMLTKTSLIRMLHKAGFSSVAEAFLPFEPNKDHTRITLIAVKGENIPLHGSPSINAIKEEEIPEKTILKNIKEKSTIIKNSVIYNAKLRSPRFIRNFYKKNIKKTDKS